MKGLMRTSGNSVLRCSSQSAWLARWCSPSGVVKPSREVGAKGDVVGVVVVVPLDEEHRHVEGVVDVAFPAKRLVEQPRQQPAAVGVDVLPGRRAPRADPGLAALDEGRIGEQRGDQRRDAHAQAQPLAALGLVGVVEISLDRTGPQHHVEGQLAARREVGPHDVVAALGHDVDLVAGREGMEAAGDPGHAHVRRDRLELLVVLGELGAGVVDGRQRLAAELELTAGLEGDRGAITLERDELAVDPALGRLGPAKAIAQGLEGRADVGVVADRRGHALVVEKQPELLLLGPDQVATRALGLLEPQHEFVHRLDRAGVSAPARWIRARAHGRLLAPRRSAAQPMGPKPSVIVCRGLRLKLTPPCVRHGWVTVTVPESARESA